MAASLFGDLTFSTVDAVCDGHVTDDKLDTFKKFKQNSVLNLDTIMRFTQNDLFRRTGDKIEKQTRATRIFWQATTLFYAERFLDAYFIYLNTTLMDWSGPSGRTSNKRYDLLRKLCGVTGSNLDDE